MKLSIFSTISDPQRRGDNFGDAARCYTDLADEVVIVNGDITKTCANDDIKEVVKHWPREFDWAFIGQQFQRGYEACTGDWVIHCDIDMIFHERDFGKIRQALKDYPSAPAVSFYKHQYILPDRYNLKSRLILAVNKAKFGDRIKFSGGGDLCQPTLDGVDLDINEMPQAGVPFYNYEHLIKTKSQTMDDVGRMDRAYYKHFGKWLYSQDGTDESAFEGWLQMVKGRYQKPQEKVSIDSHPKYVQDTIRNLKPENFGYNGWGHLKGGYFEKG